MLSGTLDVSLLRNLLRGKEVKAKIRGQGLIRAREGATRAGLHLFWLNLYHPLTYFEIQNFIKQN